MNTFPPASDLFLRVVVALLGAAALGWQRERHGKPAGLRTQMLVGLGSAMFTLVTLKFYLSLLGMLERSVMNEHDTAPRTSDSSTSSTQNKN